MKKTKEKSVIDESVDLSPAPVASTSPDTSAKRKGKSQSKRPQRLKSGSKSGSKGTDAVNLVEKKTRCTLVDPDPEIGGENIASQSGTCSSFEALPLEDSPSAIGSKQSLEELFLELENLRSVLIFIEATFGNQLNNIRTHLSNLSVSVKRSEGL
ncbi:hypothetical protein GQ44DRAFT_770439 [Phaeosphaeriaceae sp. PMI808]|nr:hypothetical protein GQ44DRAFT_770439 [Phaeosphaeriaceae sp. PMI808]